MVLHRLTGGERVTFGSRRQESGPHSLQMVGSGELKPGSLSQRDVACIEIADVVVMGQLICVHRCCCLS